MTQNAGTRSRTKRTYVHEGTVPERPAFRLGALSMVWRPRQFAVSAALAVGVVLLLLLSICLGDYPLTPIRVAEVIGARLFDALHLTALRDMIVEPSRIEELVVFDWRMPRSVTGIVVGTALGLSGALTQSVTRNALASPDILGITTGASAMAVTIIVLGGGASGGLVGWLSGVGIPVAALIGGLLTGLAIWLLAYQRGMDPFRLVLSGIIISALLMAYISFLMTRADLRDATTAQMWLSGSLNASNWTRAMPVILLVLIGVPVFAWISFQLMASILGPDVARSLGQNVTGVQVALLVFSVALAAVAVSAAGPIGFVAFVSPQIAQRLCGRSTPPLLASGLFGSCLLILADMATQSILPVELPVGLLTSAVGGLFLIYLLIQNNRRASTE
ncbi:MAG: FecCD family ABC transporter permease [Corynebacterium sp.]|uniref:FecCD family ABC transporter permease n=1 Tax=Corynebacterium sp. TaxID=1720 RepID=UPI00264774D0|nr:iron chelate uptake ABC transporter family permease subunit [Corynebacterium sp.]MDN5582800.1 iron chelate uptake ABC transporter family permease subunit [Corynebacterium sp.]MDN5719274.1 iron chelate uptake ABC transporter family permease subunit [Corynebacterium sp.]MDN6324787.1 iron chelate uptake ABC transporter family permease subunit [Corynebacterium sp.]MDN6387708.1 iron chelate uptake ABC transporter family permease subunit [Corynebacterium sp.]MDN6509133.1 iron chelate uptake ABC t